MRRDCTTGGTLINSLNIHFFDFLKNYCDLRRIGFHSCVRVECSDPGGKAMMMKKKEQKQKKVKQKNKRNTKKVKKNKDKKKKKKQQRK